MDSLFWHVASAGLSAIATVCGVLVMHIVNRLERSIDTLQTETAQIDRRVARIEGALSGN